MCQWCIIAKPIDIINHIIGAKLMNLSVYAKSHCVCGTHKTKYELAFKQKKLSNQNQIKNSFLDIIQV